MTEGNEENFATSTTGTASPHRPSSGAGGVISGGGGQRRRHSSMDNVLRYRRQHRMKDVTKLVMKMNSRRNLFDGSGGGGDGGSSHATDDGSHLSSGYRGGGGIRHKRFYSELPFQGTVEEQQEDLPAPLANATIPLLEQEATDATSALLAHAQHLENLFQVGPVDSYSDLPPTTAYGAQPIPQSIQEGEEADDDDVVYWSRDNSAPRSAAPFDVEQPQGVANQQQQQPQETTPILGGPGAANKRRNKSWWCYCCWCWNDLTSAIPPNFSLWKAFWRFFSTTFLCFMVPCTALAYILYYPLANPDLEFLPSRARLSWFLLFAVRQSVTFTLAQITQWSLQVLLGIPLFVRIAGPLFALLVMQSMGWPCLVCSWGVWNLLILHGDSPFISHWFYWTGMRLFSIQYNNGDGILQSELYGRILASMILVGVAASTKRVFVALYLSRRMLQYYRNQLEDVMSQIKVVMNVADLASQTERPNFDAMIKDNINQIAMDRKKAGSETVPTFEKKTKKDQNPKGRPNDSSDSDDDSDDDDDSDNNSVAQSDKELAEVVAADQPAIEVVMDPKVIWQSLKERAMNDRDTINFAGDDHTRPKKRGHVRSSLSVSLVNNASLIFPLLERWHEPKDKGKKNLSPNLNDILQFKRALSLMDNSHTFGPAYGSCVNRKLCVKNAVRLYKRLLKFTPGQPMLSFDVIGALAYENDGEINEAEAIALLRLFVPDKDNFLPMLSFVQACDTVYKQMRFLRASISNSTKIDGVLEDTFDVVFYIILVIAVLSLCGFNPWPLLVSLSTLVVSFAFAFGPSVAKGLEGIMLIAIRRPYDIGDRITFCGAETVANATGADSWLVEDITLSTTTLRYGATNEVATINNASVANSRIVNYGRSSKAMVKIQMQFDSDTTQSRLDEFRNRMEGYLESLPHKWISLVYHRSEAIDSDAGYVTFIYRAQHVKSWQEFGAIMMDRGKWQLHADSLANSMGIAYVKTPAQMTVGLGIAPDTKRNKAADDRAEVTQFIRSVSGTLRSSIHSAKNKKKKEEGKEEAATSDDVFDAIAEYLDASNGTPQVHPLGSGGDNSG